MRHIEKTEEPASFTQWKEQGDENWDPGWAEFDDARKQIKQAVKQALLQEQGYLCCYCEIRVDEDHGHIEHIQARHRHRDLELIYTNMLSCCPETPRRKPTTCGHARGPDDPVRVSPLDADCELRFLYTEDGYMGPRAGNDTDAAETIRILKLNDETLRLAREEVYREVLEMRHGISTEEFDERIASELAPDEDGRLKLFWATKRYVAETTR